MRKGQVCGFLRREAMRWTWGSARLRCRYSGRGLWSALSFGWVLLFIQLACKETRKSRSTLYFQAFLFFTALFQLELRWVVLVIIGWRIDIKKNFLFQFWLIAKWWQLWPFQVSYWLVPIYLVIWGTDWSYSSWSRCSCSWSLMVSWAYFSTIIVMSMVIKVSKVVIILVESHDHIEFVWSGAD